MQPLSWKQLLISMQVCHSPVGSQGSEYERRCKDAHRTSPLLCPLSRTSRSCHYQIQESLAEVLFARDRAQLLGKNGVLSMSLAQDARGKFELLRCKVVCGDWSTYSFLLDVADTGGKKNSLEKADQLAQCLQNFAKDNDRVLQVIKDTLISFVADGERCEPLSARMRKDDARDLRVQYAPVEVPLHDILLNSAGQFCLTCNKKVCIHAAGTLAVDLFAGSLRAGSSSDCPSSRQLKSLLTALNPRMIYIEVPGMTAQCACKQILEELKYNPWTESTDGFIVAGFNFAAAKFQQLYQTSGKSPLDALVSSKPALPLEWSMSEKFVRKGNSEFPLDEKELSADTPNVIKKFLKKHVKKDHVFVANVLAAGLQQWEVQDGKSKSFVACDFRKSRKKQMVVGSWPDNVDAVILPGKKKVVIRKLVWPELLMLHGWPMDVLVWNQDRFPAVPAGATVMNAVKCLVSCS